jgi:hypothetical protein
MYRTNGSQNSVRFRFRVLGWSTGRRTAASCKTPATKIALFFDDDNFDSSASPPNTDMRRLTTGIHSEKCVVRRVRRRANVIECTYTNPDGIAYCS